MSKQEATLPTLAKGVWPVRLQVGRVQYKNNFESTCVNVDMSMSISDNNPNLDKNVRQDKLKL